MKFLGQYLIVTVLPLGVGFMDKSCIQVVASDDGATSKVAQGWKESRDRLQYLAFIVLLKREVGGVKRCLQVVSIFAARIQW